MKRKILYAAVLLIISAAVSSCINEIYDFNNLNPEITLAPGISINVDKSLGEVNSDDLLGLSDCGTDENGTFIQTGQTTHSELTIKTEDIAAGTVYSDQKISVPVSVQEFLKSSKTAFRFHKPEIAFQISNPVSTAVTMSAKAKANGKEFSFTVDLPANAESHNVTIGGDDLAGLLYPVPDAISIEEISFTGKTATKAGTDTGSGHVVYDIFAQANIRMEFEPGSEISFDTVLDLEEMGADMSSISVSVKEFDILTSITSTFPLDLQASAKSEDGKTTLALANAIMANATTEVKLNAKTDGELSGIKKVTLSVYAKNTSDKAVALSPSNSLDIDINRLTATSGITYNPKK